MIGEPRFSVITIFHNEERFLPDAVASVRAQKGPSWELLLVDDGSTDRSGTIARELAAAEPDRIRYLSHDGGVNRGMSASRNLGIDNAIGRWITFLDADDIWLPGKLEGQMQILTDHRGVEVLVSPAQWWRSWDPLEQARPDWVQSLDAGGQPAVVIEPPSLVTRFLEDEWSSICDLVIGREALAAVGGYEAAFTGMFEDQVFHAKVLSRLPAVVTGAWWYRYRQHADACTATAHQRGSHLAARRAFVDWLDHHLADHRPVDDQLRRALRRQRRPLDHPHLWRAGRLVRRIFSPCTPAGTGDSQG